MKLMVMSPWLRGGKNTLTSQENLWCSSYYPCVIHYAKTNNHKFSEGTSRDIEGLDKNFRLVFLDDLESKIQVVSRTNNL